MPLQVPMYLVRNRRNIREVRARLAAHAKQDTPIDLSKPQGVTGTQLIRQEAERVRLAEEDHRRKKNEAERLMLKKLHMHKSELRGPTGALYNAVLCIQKAVQRKFPHLALEDFRTHEGKRERSPEKILMRQVGMFLSKTRYPKESNERLGECFDRTGADVIHAMRMIPKKMESSPWLSSVIFELENELKDELTPSDANSNPPG